MFFVYHNMVYHLGVNGEAHALDIRGFTDDPNQWVWQVIPRGVFDEVRQQYIAEESYRGPG